MPQEIRLGQGHANPAPGTRPNIEGAVTSFGESASRLSGASTFLLGWRPDDFWSATPAELATALSLFEAGIDGPDPDSIAALKQRFPDEGQANNGR